MTTRKTQGNKKMTDTKRGFLYIGDKISGYPKDQIGFIDRVLQHKNNVFSIRGRAITADNLGAALREVRERSVELAGWAAMNLCHNTAIIALGYSEMVGGGSSYWFDVQYKALTQELTAIGFKVCCVVPDFDHGIGAKKQAQKWRLVAAGIVDGVCSANEFERIECLFTPTAQPANLFVVDLQCIENLAEKVSGLLQPKSHLRRIVMSQSPQEIPEEIPSAKVLPSQLRKRLTETGRRRVGMRAAERAARKRSNGSRVAQPSVACKKEPPVKQVQEGVCSSCGSVDVDIYKDSKGKLCCGGCNDLLPPSIRWKEEKTPEVKSAPKKVKPARKKRTPKKVEAEIVAAVAQAVIAEEQKETKVKIKKAPRKKRKRIFIG